eukprot:g25747.t1
MVRNHAISGIKKRQQQLHDDEQHQLLRDQQQLLEDQRTQLQEHQRVLEEKDGQLRAQAKQMLEDRQVAERWEHLAEFRQRQLVMEENQMEELQARLEEASGASAPLAPGRLWGADRASSVMWGSIPWRPMLQDGEAQTDEDAIVRGLEQDLQHSFQQQSHLEQRIRGLEEELEDRAQLQEELIQAQRSLELPEHVVHAELKQAYADLRDKDSALRVEEDIAETLHHACEQRVELARDQAQALMEQTRIQASQAALDYQTERERTGLLEEEIQSAKALEQTLREELDASREEFRLTCEVRAVRARRARDPGATPPGQEADIEQRNLRASLDAQLEQLEEHSSRFQQERRLQEHAASYEKESWRRCELQPALDQAKALRQLLAEDQKHAEALQLDNHAILLEAAEKQAQLSFTSTELSFAQAEVTSWKRSELDEKLRKEDRAERSGVRTPRGPQQQLQLSLASSELRDAQAEVTAWRGVMAKREGEVNSSRSIAPLIQPWAPMDTPRLTRDVPQARSVAEPLRSTVDTLTPSFAVHSQPLPNLTSPHTRPGRPHEVVAAALPTTGDPDTRGALAPVPGGPPSSFTCCTELHELVRAACNFAGTVGAGGSFESMGVMIGGVFGYARSLAVARRSWSSSRLEKRVLRESPYPDDMPSAGDLDGVPPYIPPGETISYTVDLVDICRPLPPEKEPVVDEEEREQGQLGSFTWEASGSGKEIFIRVPLDDDVKAREIKVNVTSTALSCQIGSQKIVEGTLFAPVLTDDSFWDFEKKGKKVSLLITLGKMDASLKWDSLLQSGGAVPVPSDVEVVGAEEAKGAKSAKPA